ncbi:MAG: DUF1573 domain-containing protein [Calditrichaeota bacterium]|nr:DUF1573 domain-containing protein [Calditrichota bacterium]
MIVRILFILLILLILSVVVQAQDHENVDPVTSFCQRWGMVNDIVVQGDYAYFGTSDGGLQILDASNPENPLLAGSLMTEGVYGLCLTEEIAYTVGYDSDDYEQRDGYFAIIDITDPGSPLLHSTMETDQRAYCVTVSGDYAFVGVNGFMKVMDISDPRNPHLISEFEIQGNLEHICTNGDIAYLCASDLVAVNISNPEEPRQIATADLQIGGKDAELFGDYLIVADSYHYKDTRGTIRIFDISNPENIEEILEIEAASLNVGIVEDRLFAINDYQILQIYNISNIEDIELIAEYDSGEEVMYFEVSGNLVFLSHQGSESDGYHIGLIDATDPEEMELLNEYIKPRPTRIALDDQFAFIYSGSYNHKSLKIFDTSNLESIREIANYPSVEGIQDMKILDDVLFLTGNSGLYLFDIQNPESVRSLSHLELSGYESFPQNGYVYTKTQDGNIAIIDVSDVDDPQQVGDIDLNLEIADFDVSGDYAYLANRDSGMVIYNISNPSDPRQVAHLATKERVTGIEVEGQIAYLLLRYEHALQIVDVSDLDNLEIIGEYEQLPGFGSRMLIEDDYLYPFNRSGCSFKVFNKSDPNQLREVGYYQLTGQLQNLQLSDTLIYVVGNSNVEICRFEESGYFIVTPTSHDFGFVTFGENPEIQITIENTGNRSQSITNLISDNAAFRVDFNGEIEIAPGENHEATVTFDPEDDGPYSCILQIESDNPGGYIRQVRLTGESIRGKRFEEFGRVSDIHLTDEYAYMLQTEDTLMILDITNPAEPEQVGMRDSLSRASHIFYMDEKVFIARIKMDGISDMVVLTIYNVSDPESPIRRGTSEFTCSGPATDIEVLGHYAYISAVGSIFRYSIQNTGHPRVVGYTDLGMFRGN